MLWRSWSTEIQFKKENISKSLLYSHVIELMLHIPEFKRPGIACGYTNSHNREESEQSMNGE